MASSLARGCFFIFAALCVCAASEIEDEGESRPSTLNKNYYKKSCPDVESIVSNFVSNEYSRNPNVSAQMVRLLFHDALIHGVDGSVLLNGIPNNPAEKDTPNLRLRGFEVVEAAKAAVEAKCPATVSCADLLTLLTKAAVISAGGPAINFKLGRLDGPRNSAAAHDAMNPKASFNATQLLATFNSLGLDEVDLVALSGAHTLGITRCSRIRPRVYPAIDPRYAPDFGILLNQTCPVVNAATNPVTLADNTIALDQTFTKFDNNYYKMLFQGRGVMNSDQVLTEDSRLSETASLYSTNPKVFFTQFEKSMIKLSEKNLLSTGEVRRQCAWMNSEL